MMSVVYLAVLESGSSGRRAFGEGVGAQQALQHRLQSSNKPIKLGMCAFKVRHHGWMRALAATGQYSEGLADPMTW